MSVPGTALQADEDIEDTILENDQEATLTQVGEAMNAEDPTSHQSQRKLETEERDEDEVDNLEKGLRTFKQPAEDPTDRLGNSASPIYQPSTPNHFNQSSSIPDGKQQQLSGFGRGPIARRFPTLTNHLLPESAELARAEAASWAQMSPLMAATLGPFCVLLGIPTLTQRWRGEVIDPPIDPKTTSHFIGLPDPPLNLALAGASLACEVLGNTLLVLRFSNFHTKVTTWLSYGFWIAKLFLNVINYIEFGINYPQTDKIIYLAGFWIGVCGLGVTVILLAFLTFNLSFLHLQSEEITRRLHNVQREFMLQTLIFFLFLGVAALLFCKLEHTSYVDGIYFMIVSVLTIGFGDVTPNTNAMKILTFPFTIVGIALLALIVTSIVRLLSDRSRRRRLEHRRRLEEKESEQKRIHRGYGLRLRPRGAKERSARKLSNLRRSLTLQEELQKLREEEWKRERRANLKSMAIGFTVFLIFWCLGALIFFCVEPWSYGNSLYFCYIFFLTVGYGDFVPTSEAGRSVFIVYALLAVPTMTITVETVTTNFTAFTVERMYRKRHRVYEEKDFQIKSLDSLVQNAIRKNVQKRDSDEENSLHLPIHNYIEALIGNLQQMHHHLQSLLMRKLGPYARHVIAAERARENVKHTQQLKEKDKAHKDRPGADHMAFHLTEIGTDAWDEMELLNKYRERYAAIMAELIIAKNRLLLLEKRLRNYVTDEQWRRIKEDFAELTEEGDEIEPKMLLF